ncbi:hypothetical protein [Nocardia terrae]|nr:hypothetical protein [Nocardia terrae]
MRRPPEMSTFRVPRLPQGLIALLTGVVLIVGLIILTCGAAVPP